MSNNFLQTSLKVIALLLLIGIWAFLALLMVTFYFYVRSLVELWGWIAGLFL